MQKRTVSAERVSTYVCKTSHPANYWVPALDYVEDEHRAKDAEAFKITGRLMTRMVVSRQCRALTGDKFCTLHGQKGVVTVIPDREMVSTNGVPVDVVIGSTTLVKRGTVGQLYEAWAGDEVFTTLGQAGT